MLVQVRDNKTNNILTSVNSNNWSKIMTCYIADFRSKYSNATIEWYYGNDSKGEPSTIFKTFH